MSGRVVALLGLDRGGQFIPLTQTRQPVVLQAVADASLAEVRAAAAEEDDEVIGALLRQEAERLDRALGLLGLGGGMLTREVSV